MLDFVGSCSLQGQLGRLVPLQVLIQLIIIILMRPGSSVRLMFALINPEKSSFSNLFSEATIDPVFEKHNHSVQPSTFP